MPRYSVTERHIKKLFDEQKEFIYNEIKYFIIKTGKPRPSSGECKTDVYVLCKDTNGCIKEFKISIKQSDADFLENKISYERAVEIFGENADKIISDNVLLIKNSFESEPLINFSSYSRTKPNCIKIGWKFELLNKPGGARSSELKLNDYQKIGIYSGVNLEISKKNCFVEGELIEDSGVANFMLVVDKLENDLNYYTNKLEDINEYAIKQKVYFACKALNYRASEDKWDGDRPLSVFCEWKLNEINKLECRLIYDQPLKNKGNAIVKNIKSILSTLQINPRNFTKIKSKLSSKIILHE